MKTLILSPTPENIALCAKALRDKQVVGMPTETVYGLAGAAFEPEALARIFEAKERPTFDPLILHVCARSLAELARIELVDPASLSSVARARIDLLIQNFWPGPLTLVLPKKPRVPDLATSGLPTVGIRMPRHPVAQALIQAAGTPLAAPSANRFGRISPTQARDVVKELNGRIPYVLDGGPCEVGLESTILSVSAEGDLTLLRPGGVSRTEIESLVGVAVQLPGPQAQSDTGAKAAPGMLESHYAPSKNLVLLPAPLSSLSDDELRSFVASNPRTSRATRLGLLLLSGDVGNVERFQKLIGRPVEAKSLSESGDLVEVARNLFAGLRFLDSTSAEVLISEPCLIDQGLGHAIADRLRRASATQTAPFQC